MADQQRAPAGLAAPGRRLWRGMVAKYVLSPGEMLILEMLCRTHDELDKMHEILADSEVVVRGSRGQPVMHPLLDEVRRHTLLVIKLTAALKLPAERKPALRSVPGGNRGGSPRAG
jgi:hypothetical protein